jgi:hypothetical protein
MLQCFITISIMRGTDFRLAKWSDFNAVRLRNLTLSPEHPAEATRGHKTRSFPDGLFFVPPGFLVRLLPVTLLCKQPAIK